MRDPGSNPRQTRDAKANRKRVPVAKRKCRPATPSDEKCIFILRFLRPERKASKIKANVRFRGVESPRKVGLKGCTCPRKVRLRGCDSVRYVPRIVPYCGQMEPQMVTNVSKGLQRITHKKRTMGLKDSF